MLSPTAARVIGYSRRDVLVVPPDAVVKFSSILVALDGSDNSRNAALRSLELAKQYGSRITAVFAIQMLPEYTLWEKYTDSMEEKARTVLDTFTSQAKAENLTVDTIVEYGDDVGRCIVDQIRKSAADITVMGSHGRTGLRRLLMGSVAEQVLSQAPCPVLIVH
jgi:nucleotide-binding universal stress UspA family protein